MHVVVFHNRLRPDDLDEYNQWAARMSERARHARPPLVQGLCRHQEEWPRGVLQRVFDSGLCSGSGFEVHGRVGSARRRAPKRHLCWACIETCTAVRPANGLACTLKGVSRIMQSRTSMPTAIGSQLLLPFKRQSKQQEF